MIPKIYLLAATLLSLQVLSSAQNLGLSEKRYNNARSLKSKSKSKAKSEYYESSAPKSSSKAPKSSKSSKNEGQVDKGGMKEKPTSAPTLWTKPYGFVQCESNDDCTFGTSCVDLVQVASSPAFENVTIDENKMVLDGNNTGICSELSSGPYQSSSLSPRLLLTAGAIIFALLV